MKLHSGVVIEDSAFPIIKLTEDEVRVLAVVKDRIVYGEPPYLCIQLKLISVNIRLSKSIRKGATSLRNKIIAVVGRGTLGGYMKLEDLTGDEQRMLRHHWIKLLAKHNDV